MITWPSFWILKYIFLVGVSKKYSFCIMSFSHCDCCRFCSVIWWWDSMKHKTAQFDSPMTKWSYEHGIQSTFSFQQTILLTLIPTHQFIQVSILWKKCYLRHHIYDKLIIQDFGMSFRHLLSPILRRLGVSGSATNSSRVIAREIQVPEV